MAIGEHTLRKERQQEGISLRHAAGHKAADIEPAHSVYYWPYHSPADAVGLGDYGFVGHINPLVVDAHAIVALVGLPVDIADCAAVGIRAAQTLGAL